MNLAELRVWVAGGARSGLASALILRGSGARVFLSEAGTLSEEAKRQLNAAGVSYEEGGHSLARFRSEADALVLSPAIPLAKGLPLEARTHGIPVLSEIEVAAWSLRGHERVVAITGTNGKSTTTHYATQLLNRAGHRAVACGNFGLPFTTAIKDAEDAGAAGTTHFVLELSSYQLETTYSLRPDVAILLNLQKDHLLRYENMLEYLKAKWRLLLMVKDEGLALVDAGVMEEALRAGLPLPRARVVILQPSNAQRLPNDVPGAAGGVSLAPLVVALERARTLPVALYQELRTLAPLRALGAPLLTARVDMENGAHATHGAFSARWQLSPQTGLGFDVSDPVLPGFHNATNLLAASIAAAELGVSKAILKAQWETATSDYLHLAHRLEFVVRKETPVRAADGSRKAVVIVNDSKATNVESTLMALRSFKSGVRLLVGGEPKGEEFLSLVPFFKNPVTKFYPFGAASSLLKSDLTPVAGQGGLAPSSATLLEAAEAALADAEPGDVVLLSPGCASFDAFKNFEHRGDIFKEWALSKV